jgi:LPS-assembly lipoprotein
MQRRSLHRRSLLLVALPLLAACGFELRRPPVLSFRTIALVGFAPRSPLADELRQALAASSAGVVERPARADVVFEALADNRPRSVVASTAAGQVRELQLGVRLVFRLSTPQGRSLIEPTELLLTRDMSYSESAALAKEQEEAELLRAMQADIVAQVMRRLAAVEMP